MGLQKWVRRLLPVYRVAEVMEKQLQDLQHQTDRLTLTVSRQELELRRLASESRTRFWLGRCQGEESPWEARQRVFLSFPPATGALRQLQLANLSLLRRLRRLCEQNGLPFILFGGTLLGSVRHHGFIPWDDDIDLAMLRRDYLRLTEVIGQDPALRVDMYYNWEYGAVCPKVKYRDCESFWVDIFLAEELDATPENAGERWQRLRRTAEELQAERMRIIRKYYPADTPCLLPFRDERVDAEVAAVRDRLVQPLDFYGHGDYLTDSLDENPLFIENLCRREEVLPLSEQGGLYEGEAWPIPRNTEAYLIHTYGDYMEFPADMDAMHQKEISQHLEEDLRRLRERGEAEP